MEFKEVIESIQADAARERMRGWRLTRGTNDPGHLARLAEAAKLLAGVQKGDIPAYRFQEALTTSDFPLLFGQILDRQLLGSYQEFQPTWPNYIKRGTVRDFRVSDRLYLDGLEGSYFPAHPKPEGATPNIDEALTEGRYQTQVVVYEKKATINWRMLVNDDLDAFSTLPERLARGARRTEERRATTLFVDANGPDATFYTNGNRNCIVQALGAAANNPPLSIAGLQDGMTILGNMIDADGEPIVVDAVELVVPPALSVTALNIMNALEINVTPNAVWGTAMQEIRAANWMRNKMRLSVNPYIPIVASNANGNTSWFLFANPVVSRAAMELTFLRGYEQPGIFMKAPNTQRVGGGVDPTLGDFDTNEITYKGLHILGGCQMDVHASVASTGGGGA